MVRAKIAVLVSGGGTNLQALIDTEKKGDIKSGHIILVASNNSDAYGLKRGKLNGIETYIYNGEEDLIDKILEKDIDMLVLAGFLKILSPEFIAKFNKPIINIHPSLIPSFCGKGCYGLNVHKKALEYGIKITGATVHYVNEIPDGGEIIYQKAVDVLPGDTPEVLQKRVMEEAEWIILPKAVETVAKKIVEEKNE